MSKFEALVDSVLVIDDSKSRADILLDLQYTNSVEETINRIFDGKVSPNQFQSIFFDTDNYSF